MSQVQFIFLFNFFGFHICKNAKPSYNKKKILFTTTPASYILASFLLVRVCGFAGLRVCGFAGLRVCGFAGLRVCGFAGLRVCGFAGLRVCGFAGLRVCGFAGLRVCGFAECGFAYILVFTRM